VAGERIRGIATATRSHLVARAKIAGKSSLVNHPRSIGRSRVVWWSGNEKPELQTQNKGRNNASGSVARSAAAISCTTGLCLCRRHARHRPITPPPIRRCRMFRGDKLSPKAKRGGSERRMARLSRTPQVSWRKGRLLMRRTPMPQWNRVKCGMHS